MLPWDAEVAARQRRSAREWVDRVGAFLESRPVKVTLALLIVLSLLPEETLGASLEERLRPVFLGVFGLEALLRAALLVGAPSAHRRSDCLFLLFDLLAFLSFLPLQQGIGRAVPQELVLLRLARLLMLVRFARGLVRDVYLTMTRREQLLQFGLVTAFVLALTVISALLLVHLGVAYKYDEENERIRLRDALWWSFRQIESADNLVKGLDNPVLLTVLSLTLTVIGVFVISFLIGIGSNIVEQVVRAERRRPVSYRGHALVIGPVEQSELLVREFIGLYHKNRMLRRLRPMEIFEWLFCGGPRPRRHALPRMVLLGTQDEPPAYLHDEMMRWVVYRQGDGADPAGLRLAAGAHAKRVILLSRPEAGPDADAMSVATLAALRAENQSGHVFVEVREGQNRNLVEEVGGPGTFPLDAPRMSALFLAQHLVVPGVEHLYRELMEHEGSEFYTHIYVDPREIAMLAGQGGHVRFSDLAERAYRDHHVTLTGVFLGRGAPTPTPMHLVPMEGLLQWANPLAVLPDPQLRALGAEPDRVPLSSLRGLIGVCSSYDPLRRLGRELVRRPAAPSAAPGPPPAGLAEALDACTMDLGGLRRVLLCGFSAALPSLLRELARFVPNLEAMLVLGERDDEHLPLQRKLEMIGLGLGPGEMPGERGTRVPLTRGGSAVIYTHAGANLADFAVRCLRAPVDAAVFLSEQDALDRDARTGMRVLRFAEAVAAGAAPRGERLHLVAEFVSRDRGERIERLLRRRSCGFSDPARLRVTMLGTDSIRTYFLVRSAFVPGLTAVFTELLAHEGQALYRLGMPQDVVLPGEPLSMSAFRRALAARGMIPLALELSGGRVVLNPLPTALYEPGEVVGLYVLAAPAAG